MIDGIGSAGGSLARGLSDGVSGLIKNPLKGAERGGFAGFAKGVGTGMLGLVVKPVVGVTDAATDLLQGSLCLCFLCGRGFRCLGREHGGPLARFVVCWVPLFGGGGGSLYGRAARGSTSCLCFVYGGGSSLNSRGAGRGREGEGGGGSTSFSAFVCFLGLKLFTTPTRPRAFLQGVNSKTNQGCSGPVGDGTNTRMRMYKDGFLTKIAKRLSISDKNLSTSTSALLQVNAEYYIFLFTFATLLLLLLLFLTRTCRSQQMLQVNAEYYIFRFTFPLPSLPCCCCHCCCYFCSRRQRHDGKHRADREALSLYILRLFLHSTPCHRRATWAPLRRGQPR